MEVYGDADAEAGMFIMNSAAEAAKIVVDELKEEGKSVKLIEPYVLRPFPAKEIVEAVGDTKRLVVAERVSPVRRGQLPGERNRRRAAEGRQCRHADHQPRLRHRRIELPSG